MTRNRRRTERRQGIAAVELAVLLPLLVALMVGLWEVGRVVMVHNVLANAAYEGGRLAASAGFWSSNNYTDPTTGLASSLPYSQDSSGNPIPFDVQKRVLTYLSAAGISTTGATIEVENLSANWSGTWSVATSSGTTSGNYDPAVAASQLDHLRVTVQLPYSSVQWSTLALFIPDSYTVTSVVDVYSLNNVPITVSTTLPQSVQ